MSSPSPHFTARFKGDPHTKKCVDCNKTKNRLTEFKPRWGKCSEHRKTTKRGETVEGCDDCENARNSVVRQPRCVECDATRGKKKAAKTTATATPAKKDAAKKPAKKKVSKKKPAKPAKKAEPIEVTTASTEVEPETSEPITVTEEVPAVETPALAKSLSSKEVLKQMVEDDEETAEAPSKAEEADSPF